MKSFARRFAHQLTYANVTASLALFIALGGISYAAVKLPSNSVATKHLKNGAVTMKKIDRRTAAALKGRTGAQGAAGAIGPQGAPGVNGANGIDGTNGADGANGLDGANGTNGTDGTNGLDGAVGPTGPTGPSELYASNAPLADETLTQGQFTTVKSIELPEGSYLISSTGHIANTAAPFLTKRRTECGLYKNGATALVVTNAFNGAFDTEDVVGSAGVYQSIALQEAITLATPTTVSVACTAHGGDTNALLSLMALRVGTIIE